MQTQEFIPIYGTIQSIQPVRSECCQHNLTVRTREGIVNVIVGAETYVIKDISLRVGMSIAAFYDANVPVPLIFPPRYRAVAIGRQVLNETIVMNFFDNNLVSADNSLKLNIARSTRIIASNGQPFTCNIRNRVLIVFYQTSTRSIPAQTTPSKIIVMC